MLSCLVVLLARRLQQCRDLRAAPAAQGPARDILTTLQYACVSTANLRAKILDFRGFDSSIILVLGGGLLMSIGTILESLNQAILLGII